MTSPTATPAAPAPTAAGDPRAGRARTAEDYRAALRDSRTVVVDGETVDVTSHPGFAGAIDTVGRLYDLAAEPASPLRRADGVNRVFAIPRSRDDLTARRDAITRWAEVSMGFLGRGPDHVAGFVAGFAARPGLFDGQRPLGANVTAYHRRMAAESRYTAYCIIPPSVDRAAVAEGAQPRQVAVVHTDDDGVVVRGAQILGTGAAVADDLLVSAMTPLKPGGERFAWSFVVPIATPGLTVRCRRLYATTAPSTWDYPLTSRFDETDALVTFDDVRVPWSEVFVAGDTRLVRAQFHETPAHVLGNAQAQARLAVKLKFLLGIAAKVVTVSASSSSDTLDQLAELASLAAQVEGMLLASEYTATVDDTGTAIPGRRHLYAAMATQAELYPRVLHLLRLLCSSQLINLPASYRDLTSSATGPALVTEASSPATPGEARMRLFKLAWDAVGSEFASRHHQYEMFYAGSPAVARTYARLNYGLDEAVALAETFLAGYGLPR